MRIIFDEREVRAALQRLLQEKYGIDAEISSVEYQINYAAGSIDEVIIDLEGDGE